MSKEEEYMTATRKQELLIESVIDAHSKTCRYTSDQIAVIMRRRHDITTILCYKNLDHGQLWLICSQQLCKIMLGLTQFAVRIPSFMHLPLSERVLLIKAGCFKMSVIRMSRFIDHLTGYVMFNEIMLPSEVFTTTADTAEMKLVNDTFQIAKRIADLKLSESELALYSACVLFSPDCPVWNDLEIQSYCQSILRALKSKLDQTHKLHKGDISVFDILIAQLTDLQDLSILHLQTLRKVMRSAPQLNFPPVYYELFC